MPETDKVLCNITKVRINGATSHFNALFSSEHASVTSV